jgi:hypothetical protein
MWMLVVVIIGLSRPIIIQGYETETRCDEVGEDAKFDLVNPVMGQDVSYWCVEIPPQGFFRGKLDTD